MSKFKSAFSSVKNKFSQVSTSTKAAVSGFGLAVASEMASADTSTDIQAAFDIGKSNLGTAVAGLFGLLALIVAVGLIYKIMNK